MVIGDDVRGWLIPGYSRHHSPFCWGAPFVAHRHLQCAPACCCKSGAIDCAVSTTATSAEDSVPDGRRQERQRKRKREGGEAELNRTSARLASNSNHIKKYNSNRIGSKSWKWTDSNYRSRTGTMFALHYTPMPVDIVRDVCLLTKGSQMKATLLLDPNNAVGRCASANNWDSVLRWSSQTAAEMFSQYPTL